MVVFEMKFAFLLLPFVFILPIYADLAQQYAVNKFSIEFYKEASMLVPDENFIASPFSAQVILGLLSAGAKGHTQQEILNAIHTNNSDTTKSMFKSLMTALKTTNGDILNILNKIYVKDGANFELSPDFKSISKDTFLSNIENINFSKKEEAAGIINNWVKNVTNNKIEKLISSDSIDKDIRVMLINAIYFQGNWKYPFDKKFNRKVPFYINDEETVEVEMMHKHHDFPIASSNELDSRILSLPYESSESSLVIVLPKKKKGFSNLEKKIMNVDINEILSKAWTDSVYVEIPKFKIETSIDLKNIFPQLGIERIFNPDNAELKGILRSDEDLFVSKAIQKAFIEVDEQGTKAAAATGIEAVSYSRPMEFKADHPFLYLIMNNGNIVFCGKYMGK